MLFLKPIRLGFLSKNGNAHEIYCYELYVQYSSFLEYFCCISILFGFDLIFTNIGKIFFLFNYYDHAYLSTSYSFHYENYSKKLIFKSIIVVILFKTTH